MITETYINLRDAATQCGYKNTRSFMRGWVAKYKVPYERRGREVWFVQSILDRAKLRIAEAAARRLYR